MRGRGAALTIVFLVTLILGIVAGIAGCGGSAGEKRGEAPPSRGGVVVQPGADQPTGGRNGALEEGETAGIPAVSGVEPVGRLIPATVVRVIDGDTFEVKEEAGRTERVRLIGVNTPEVSQRLEPYGFEASAYTEKALHGRRVWLELDVGERDKYGRLLAYVWLSMPTGPTAVESTGEFKIVAVEDSVRHRMFNAMLLLDGMAQVMTVPPNVRYADLFLKFQREAREAGRGLWRIDEGTPAKDSEGYYVGNANSRKFHRPECKWAEKISPKNRVRFATRSEAVERGFQPCAVCKP